MKFLARCVIREFTDFPLHELEMDVKRIQRVTDFVRDSGGKQRECVEPLAFNRFLR